jgi:hypothetical protein
MMFTSASCVVYVSIGCRHPFMRYWQALLATTTATCSQQDPQSERQWSVNIVRSRIFRNQVIARIIAHKTKLLTVLIGKNTIYKW